MSVTPSRRAFLGLLVAIPVSGTLIRPALAEEPWIFAPDGVAINGTDPVAYFTEGKPVQGLAEHSVEWKGSTWHFASAENRAAFEMNADGYAPQYGGYCAYAVSQGYTAKTVPDAWTVHNDKLYLNFSKGVRRRWLRDIDGHIASGDANWPSVLSA